MMRERKIDFLWDDNPVDVTSEANFIWSIANKLRGSYMPDKYGDVIIPMVILRRFECALEATKNEVIKQYEDFPAIAPKVLCKKSGFQFYNVSRYNLKKLCDDSSDMAENFKAYINGFSANVQDILTELELLKHIEKMEKDGCLFTVVEAFSKLDLSIKTFDSIKMGYIFENLIGRFYQNVDAGQFYTGRDIIKMLVSVLISEGCDDIFDDNKVITVCDQACGTGGMLSTAYSYLKHFNPTCDVRLFGQEFMGQSYAVGLAEMLIKGQNAENFRHADSFKVDHFKDQKMRFVIENPPFGTPWSGKDAKEGQEVAVKTEYLKGMDGRWGAGLPSGGDSQLIFMQSAINKMDPKLGRAAIISNGSPLFTGNTSSGESQIRRWMLENDLIEAIIALPSELFYNTGIQTYVWILSHNKRKERQGKIQLIDATTICHKLRKALGNKKNELTPEDRKIITELYTNFEENDYVKIYNNEEFIYREYTIMQPMQRNYTLTLERINSMIQKGTLSSLYDETKVYELENSVEVDEEKKKKEHKKLLQYYANKETYYNLIKILNDNCSSKVYYNPLELEKELLIILDGFDKKIIKKIVDGLSEIDKTAPIQTDKKGNVIYDKETKDIEIVSWFDNIDVYMINEVLSHIPDAVAFFEGENINASFLEDRNNKTIKIGAEIPFTRLFYKYTPQESSEKLLNKIKEIEYSTRSKIDNLL